MIVALFVVFLSIAIWGSRSDWLREKHSHRPPHSSTTTTCTLFTSVQLTFTERLSTATQKTLAQQGNMNEHMSESDTLADSPLAQSRKERVSSSHMP